MLILFGLILSYVSYGQVQSVSLQASGLTCSMCSKAIYKSLLKVRSVAKVTEDIEHSSYTIAFKANEKIVLDDLKKAVMDAGFSVARMEVKANFDHVGIPKDMPLVYNDISFVVIGASKQELNGEQMLMVIDKDFLSEKERQKYAHLMEGKSASSTRAYHVIIRQS